MHEINTDYCKVVIEDRRRMATEFFYRRHVARLHHPEKSLKRQDRHTQLRIGVNVSAIRRLIRFTSRRARTAESYARE